MTQVVLVTSSFRDTHSNTYQLAQEFRRGAEEAGAEVTEIEVNKLDLHPCRGCYACEKLGHCVQNDAMNDYIDTLEHADIIAFATPTYFYNISGQLKVFLDRTMPLYFRKLSRKNIYLITCAESTDVHTPDGLIASLKNWLRCFPGMHFIDTVFGGGVVKPDTIKLYPDVLQKSYRLGLSTVHNPR